VVEWAAEPVPHIPEQFERDTNGTESDWLRTLPGACGAHALSLPAPGEALVRIEAGTLHLRWQLLPPHRIALVSLPHLLVRYRFEGLKPEQRERFMKYFDLYMQRGGG
jgi:hypothetical protein